MMKRVVCGLIVAVMVVAAGCGAALFAQTATIYVGGTPQQGTRDSYAAVLPTLNDALDWLDLYTKDGGNYAIVMGSDQTVSNVVLDYDNKRVTVSLAASGGGRTVKGGFNVEKAVTLILEEGVTISGADVSVDGAFIMNGGTLRDSTNGAVNIGSGGSFTMHGGSITGNWSYRGGVYVGGGTFTLNGGIIGGNSASINGGGVYVSGGTFTMKGGTISGNTASGSRGFQPGGGVYIEKNGVFTMEGGTISENTASNGGGVYIDEGTFTMTGGTISGNEGKDGGGGVYVRGTFTMNAGTINRNTARVNGGGGVYVGYNGWFNLTGGTISGNTAELRSATFGSLGNGGGVYVYSGVFTMSGGVISGNTANGNTGSGSGSEDGKGGGVYVSGGNRPGMFTKSGTGGIIYGSNAPAAQANKAKSEAVAVYVDGSRPQKRNTTAGETTALDSTKNLVQGGGWE
jgi:hypothetical protein